MGLLPACNHEQVPFAYSMYTRNDVLGWAQSTAFKKAFSIDVDIDFIGVWWVRFSHAILFYLTYRDLSLPVLGIRSPLLVLSRIPSPSRVQTPPSEYSDTR